MTTVTCVMTMITCYQNGNIHMKHFLIEAHSLTVQVSFYQQIFWILLNEPISGIEIERVVFPLTNGKFTGIDDIPAEVLNNSSSVDLLDRIIKYCFENGTIPSIWGP